MVDLVGTCPMGFWNEWIAEGDAAGDPETGEEWGWYTEHSYRSLIKPGDRFYVVAHGMLRGWAPVLGMQGGAIVRKGGAIACTIPEPIPGFRGLRKRWWPLDIERPFPDWKTAGLITKQPRSSSKRAEPNLFEPPLHLGEMAGERR